MDRPTVAFWLLVCMLLGASLFYGAEVAQLRAAQQPRDAALASGDVVSAVQVLDGDTLVVAKEGAGQATVRLLGIKSFDAKVAKDEAAAQGRAAEDALRRASAGQPLRVLLNNPPRDRHGRTLATLYAGGDDIALGLVARGHVLVYTVYPFAQMPAYLQAQHDARQRRLGLWADPATSERAEGLMREWARAAP
ncbi:MAG: thermonuclease family protein [Rubrivivax sp.]